MIYRTEIVADIGLFDDTYTNELDWEYWIRTILMGYVIGYLPEKLYLYRRHNMSESQLNSMNMTKYDEILSLIDDLYSKYNESMTKYGCKKTGMYKCVILMLLKDLLNDIFSLNKSFFKKCSYLCNVLRHKC
jgi:hypothetical protein